MKISKYTGFYRGRKLHQEATISEIVEFDKKLQGEKKSYGASFQTLVDYTIMVVERRKSRIVGIAYITPKFIVPRSHIVVNKEYQGKGIGKKLLKRKLKISKKFYSYLFIQIKKKNYKSIGLYKKFQPIYIGEIQGHLNYVIPFNLLGFFYCYFLKFSIIFLDLLKIDKRQ